MEKLTLTVPEAAEMIGCSAASIYQMCRTNSFPCKRIGEKKTKILISRRALEKWLEEGECKNDK